MSYEKRADGTVVLTMSRADYERLLMSLGMATAVESQAGDELLREHLQFVNRINEGNPDFNAYDTEGENPEPEVATISKAELRSFREVPTGELQMDSVYILQGPKDDSFASTWNYAGPIAGMHPRTGSVEPGHRFRAPRLGGQTVSLIAMPDGTVQDADGNKITIREYRGPTVQ